MPRRDDRRRFPAWFGARPVQVVLLLLVLAGVYNLATAPGDGRGLLGPVCAFVSSAYAFSVTVQARRQHTGRW